MHIDTTTHEHGVSAKVYTYQGDYETGDDRITWRAVISHGDTPLTTFDGAIPLTSPAVTALAEQAVRDEIVKRIDAYGDQPH